MTQESVRVLTSDTDPEDEFKGASAGVAVPLKDNSKSPENVRTRMRELSVRR
eukprot:gene8585-biopygen2706